MQSTVQHGRQTAQQPAAPPTDPRTDPRTRNQPPPTVTADLEGVCRDFIWGICSMGPQCKYRHELEFESMKAVLKFCHDHQNRSTGCSRSDCSYLHTSREEENLFLTTGQIPRLLLARYTAMSQVESPATSTTEPATKVPPKNNNMMYDYIVQPPPPPPPLPAPASASTHPPKQPINNPNIQGSIMTMQNSIQGPILNPMQGPMPNPIQGPMPNPMQGPMPNSMLGSMQGQMTNMMQGPMSTSIAPLPAPLPPPPPPPPHTSSVSSLRLGSAYSVAMMQPQPNISAVYQPIRQPSSIPPPFDPSVPPPPLPQPSTSLKRAPEEIEAGPSKLRKPDNSNDSSCELCVQRLIRSELNHQQSDTMATEIVQLRAEISARMDEYDRKKMVLKALLNPDMYRLTQDYIENGSPMTRSENYNSTNLFSSSVTSANNSIIHQLVDMILANNSRGLIDPIPPASPQEDELFRLTARSRSSNWSADALNKLLDLIRGPMVSAETERPSTSSNGYGRYMDGSSPSRFYEASRSYADVSKPAGRGYEGSSRTYTAMESAGPSFEETRYPPPAVVPPRTYPSTCESVSSSTASPAAPPFLPAGAGYSSPSQPPRPPTYSYPPNMAYPPTIPYSGVMVQPHRQPPPPAQNAHNPYFVGGRYPNQTYYPPYQ